MDSLNAAEAEVEAIGRQRDQAKKRFDVGLASITEVQDTQAAYDLSVVGRITREAQLDSAKEALSAIIGGDLPLLSPLKDDYPTPPPDPIDREEWVKIGLANNFQLKAAHLNTSAAKSSARASGSAHLPKIDIVGRVTRSTSDQGKFGGFIQNPLYGLESDNRQYAIQISMPIFSGGAVSSARRQAYAQYDRTKEQTLFTERSVIREVRSNHFNVQTQSANVTARRQALKSANSALEATQIGFEVGTRNVVDLLQSERGLYAAQRDYAKSRYDYVISVLRLKLSVGSLSPEDLFNVSSQMK
jgi:outer membrane protein